MNRSVRPGVVAAVLAICWIASLPVAAREYPNRPIRWIVPVPPGATTDILSRMIGGRMAESWGNHIQFVILGPPTVMAHLKAGRLKAIATTAAKRSPGLPDTPTFAESGLPGYDTYEWYGVFAPAKIPRPVLQKLNAEINRIIALPDMKEKMLALGTIPNGGSPEAFAAFLDAERKKWGPVAQKVGLTPN